MGGTVATAPSIVRFEQVSKAFGEHVVYDAMDLDIRAGETFTIIGGSGEGKSVCLKMMIGLLRPDSGRVMFKDVQVDAADDEGLRQVRRQVAYVFQGGALFDSLSVLDNIGYGLREHAGMGDDEIRVRALECLELVGLKPDALALMPASLSMGMRKRVALARSIALRPEVILYDEPTTGLDPKLVAKIGDMILELQRELRVTSVVVTHDMPTAHKVSDRVAMLFEKKFPFVGPVEQMWRSDRPEVRDFIHGTLRKRPAATTLAMQGQEARHGA